MAKNKFLFTIAFSGAFLLLGCEQRRDFCDCMDITKALTDGFTLSKKEMEAKERGCKWIEEELSQLEIMQRMAQCYKGKLDNGQKSPPTSVQQQTTEETPSQATNSTSNNSSDFEINPNDQLISSSEVNETSTQQASNELRFMFNYVLKKTKEDIDLLNNAILRRRLQDLLGSRFTDLESIYTNSESSEIWIPYRKLPNEIDITLLDENDPNGTNATIVLDPKRNLINVNIRKNGRSDNFYENGLKSEIFKEFYDNQ